MVTVENIQTVMTNLQGQAHHNMVMLAQQHMDALKEIVNSNTRGGSSGSMTDTVGIGRPVVFKGDDQRYGEWKAKLFAFLRDYQTTASVHPLTGRESRGPILGTRALAQCTHSDRPSPHRVARGSVSSNGEFDGLLVPRPVHTDGPSHEEGALAWALIIESGHIPLRTRLRFDGTGTQTNTHSRAFMRGASPHMDPDHRKRTLSPSHEAWHLQPRFKPTSATETLPVGPKDHPVVGQRQGPAPDEHELRRRHRHGVATFAALTVPVPPRRPRLRR